MDEEWYFCFLNLGASMPKLCHSCHAASMPVTLEPKLPCAQSQRKEDVDRVPMH